MKTVIFRLLAAAVFAAPHFYTPVAAQQYPIKPIRIIVQFGPSSTTDIIARFLGQELALAWGQPVIVDNRAGATGIIGTEMGARALPDGYTLTMAPGATFGITPGLHSKLPYDTIKDFAPITNLGVVPMALVTNPSFPARTISELVALAKARPGQLNYASLGAGATGHLTMEMFRSRAGFEATNIPYKGGADAHAQVIGGQVPLIFDALPSVLPHIKSGRMRALAVSTTERSPFLPDVPTIAESGYAGFEAVAWLGVVAPAKTPAPVLDKLHAEIVRILKAPAAKERLNALGFTPVGDSREAFGRFIEAEIEKWAKAVRVAGVKVE